MSRELWGEDGGFLSYLNQFGIMASTSSQAIEEPTRAEAESLTTLTAIFAWAKIYGDLLYPASMAGSLLMGLADSGALSIAEFGSLLTGEVEEYITGDWRYSYRTAAPPDEGLDEEDGIPADTNRRPSAATKCASVRPTTQLASSRASPPPAWTNKRMRRPLWTQPHVYNKNTERRRWSCSERPLSQRSKWHLQPPNLPRNHPPR